MTYIHYEFDTEPGETIEVTLDRPANVLLMDEENYESYRLGQEYRYNGGYATSRLVRLPVTKEGRSHVVVDLGGGPGRVRASARHKSGISA